MPGDLVSNAPPFQTAWRGSLDSIQQQQRSPKKHTTQLKQLLLELINVRKYHTVIWRFLVKNTEPNLRKQEHKNMTAINEKQSPDTF